MPYLRRCPAAGGSHRIQRLALVLLLLSPLIAEAGLGVGKIDFLGAASIEASGTSTLPVAGFIPQVVMGITNATFNVFEWETVRQASIVGGPLPSPGSPYYTVALLDTGANVSLLSVADRSGFALADTARTIELAGAGPNVVTADIMTAAGFFADGMQALAGGPSPDTSAFVGVSNVEAIGARPDDFDLPTVMGLPFSVFYTIVISTDRTYYGNFNGQDYASPQIEFFTSRYDPGVPLFEHRLHATFDVPGQLPPVFVPPDFELFGIPPLPTASAAMFVDAELGDNGRVGGGQFLFDTGAQVTVISQDNAIDLQLDLANPEFTVEIIGIGGTVEQAPGFTVDTLNLPATGAGDLTLTGVPVIVLNITGSNGLYIDGIIGMNLFTDRDLVIDAGYTTVGEVPVWGNPFIGIGTARIPGDTDSDGDVDVVDLGSLAGNYGTTTGMSWVDGDFDHDGDVDIVDLGALAGNYGTGSGALNFEADAAGLGLIPEPGTLCLLVMGGLVFLRRKQK